MSTSLQQPVVLYKDKNYSGTTVGLAAGRWENIATATGMPRGAVSSVKVAPFYAVTLYSGTVYGGNSMRITGPAEIPDLSRYSTGFNDKTESVIVESLPPTQSQLMGCCMPASGVASGSCGPYTPDSAACKTYTAQYCSKNMDKPFCQSWCRNNTELCDAGVIAYCKKNPNDPYCACVNSPAGKIANPKCVDSKCIKFGYLTTNMARTACPDMIDCSVRAKLVNSGVSLATVVPIAQNCSGDSGGGSVSAPPAGVGGGGLVLTTPLIVLLFLFVVLIAIVTAVLAAGAVGGPVDVRV